MNIYIYIYICIFLIKRENFYQIKKKQLRGRKEKHVEGRLVVDVKDQNSREEHIVEKKIN